LVIPNDKEDTLLHYPLWRSFCLFFAKIKTDEKTATFSIQNIAKTYTAGNAISISLRQNRKLPADLYLIHSYSKIIVNAKNENGKLTFKFPLFLLKTGSVSWHLLSKNSKASTGTFKIVPNNTPTTKLRTI
jgi:hypothetical protein